MSVTTRRLAAIAAPVLLAGALSSCGVGGPPTDASSEEFCGAFNGAIEDLTQSAIEEGGEPPAGDVASALKSQGADLEEVGTPDGIPDDARSGFEIYVEEIGDVDEGELAEAIESGDDDGLADVSDDEEEDVDAFTEYAGEECGAPDVG